MTHRERFMAVFRFEPQDRPWRLETIGFWNETIGRWHKEGLPAWVLTKELAMPYYRFDPWIPLPIGTDVLVGFFPPFVPKLIKREGKYEIIRDFTGKTYRRFRDGAAAIPQHIGSPVENMDDFNRLRWRLEPDFPGRSENPLVDGFSLAGKTWDLPLVLHVTGPFAFHRHLMGVENLMYAYTDQKELVHAMSAQWERLTTGVIRRLAKKGVRVSAVNFWEDMCYKTGPIISPRTFREFNLPYYKRVIAAAKDTGVEGFMVDTDGNCTLLIPLFVEAGVNLLYPFEVQAGMDIREVRAEWGTKLAIMGGLNKRALEGTEADIEAEVMGKVPEMLKSGGYIPGLDHAVHPEVPLKNFEFYIRLLRETRWG